MGKKRRSKKAGAGGDAYKKHWSGFNQQLAGLGLSLRDAAEDGNCLFRAVADALEGEQRRHMAYRQAVVEFMKAEPEHFEPFVDGDFETYLRCMRNDGEWAGNLELAAVSRCVNCHVIVHQFDAPRFEIRNYDSPTAGYVHLGYHLGQHYSSVRLLSDLHSSKQAKPIVLPSGVGGIALNKAEAIIQDVTDCRNLAYIRKVLSECGNDTDVAVELLVAEQQMGIDWDNLPEEECEIKSTFILPADMTKKKGKGKGRKKKAEGKAQDKSSTSTKDITATTKAATKDIPTKGTANDTTTTTTTTTTTAVSPVPTIPITNPTPTRPNRQATKAKRRNRGGGGGGSSAGGGGGAGGDDGGGGPKLSNRERKQAKALAKRQERRKAQEKKQHKADKAIKASCGPDVGSISI